MAEKTYKDFDPTTFSSSRVLLTANPTTGELGKVTLDQLIGYKIAIINFAQSATDDPNPTVLQNLIGAITYTRLGVGSYSINSAALFTADKTIIPPFGDFFGNWNNMSPVFDSGGTGALVGFFFAYYSSSSSLRIEVYDNTGTAIEWSTLFGDTKIPITICVFP